MNRGVYFVAEQIAEDLLAGLRARQITKIEGGMVEDRCAQINCTPSERRHLVNRVFRRIVELS